MDSDNGPSAKGIRAIGNRDIVIRAMGDLVHRISGSKIRAKGNSIRANVFQAMGIRAIGNRDIVIRAMEDSGHRNSGSRIRDLGVLQCSF